MSPSTIYDHADDGIAWRGVCLCRRTIEWMMDRNGKTGKPFGEQVNVGFNGSFVYVISIICWGFDSVSKGSKWI